MLDRAVTPRSPFSIRGHRPPRIGPAPEFALTSQDGAAFALVKPPRQGGGRDLHQPPCTDTCPLLTAKMALVQERLGAEFGSDIPFASITVDPERDTPEVLAAYAQPLRS